jgi:hypothetical protein
MGGGEVMKLLPGQLLELTQSANSGIEDVPSSTAAATIPFTDGGAIVENEQKRRVMLVYVVGGLTYLEVAALRYLSRDPSYPYTIVMATTNLVNGSTLLHSLVHEF